MIDKLLEFGFRMAAIVKYEIGLSTQMDRDSRDSPRSIALVGCSSSTARPGSLRCKAMTARIARSQYLWANVSSGKSLSSPAASFSAAAVSPA